MQDMTSPIQPLTNAPKKYSCWVYGLATIGGCSVVLFVGLIASIIIAVVQNTDEGTITWSNTYTDPTTGQDVTVTNTYSLRDTLSGGITLYQLLRDADITLSELQSQDPEVLESCMMSAIGEARINEIFNGNLPSESEIAALKTCIK